MVPTNSSPHAMECRICKSVKKAGLIVSPCLCKGSMGYVHCRCLEKWMEISSRTSCEICSMAFKIVRVRRYTWRSSLRLWFSRPAKQQYLVFDSILAFIMTVIFLTTLMVWIVSMKNLEAPTLVRVFLVITVVGYAFTMYLVASYHLRPWYRWWSRCYRVKLMPTDKHETNVATV